MAKSLLDVFFPPVCICCGARISEAGMLCSECYGRLRFIEAPFCRICGRPLQISDDDAVCTECRAGKKAFETARSAFVYGDIVKDLVLSLKYGDKTDLAFWMARMMVNAGRDILDGADMLVCVPLHPLRLLDRKYNQSALLAENISKLSGVPFSPFVLKRVKRTAKQGHFSRNERYSNLTGAFDFFKSAETARTYVLIDDVMTSGATAEYCARALKRGGAREVSVLTFARAVR